jgi:hypothetical protein
MKKFVTNAQYFKIGADDQTELRNAGFFMNTYMEVVMRKFFYALLVMFTWASVYAQVPKSPISNAAVSTTKPTFKWSKLPTAVAGYEFCLLTSAADSSNNAIPVGTTVGKWKRYVQVGTTASDTTFTLDSVLARTTSIRNWKVRAKYSSTTFGYWVYGKATFTVGTPAASISNANVDIKIDHDVYSAVRQLTYKGGSNKQILDTTYNDTNKFGLGGNGSRDTLVSWYTNSTDTNTFTYQNTGKYGKTGLKVLTIAYGASGVNVDVKTTLETAKAVTLSAAWKPGGDLADDNVILVKNTATKTALSYPGTVATFGPDSVSLAATYDQKFDEYFGFKSDSSLVAVTNSQQTAYFKQAFSLNNTSGANKDYTLSFAVKKTRAEFFDVWANNRPIFVTNIVAAGDTVARGDQYVAWESFGAKPDTILYSEDGTTFTGAKVISKDTVSVDSVQYRIPNGLFGTTSVLKVISSKGDVGVSAPFNVGDRYIAFTTPAANATVVPGPHTIIWSNLTGVALTKVNISLDSGKTYSDDLPVTSSLAVDSVLFNFAGAKTVSPGCYLRAYTAAGDTGTSGMFTIGSGGAVFSIPALFADPAGTVAVPVNFADGVAGDSLKAFDFKVTFDSTFVTFTGVTYNTSLDNWVTLSAFLNNKPADSSYVRVSAFKNSTGVGVKNAELCKLNFTVKDKQSIIGQTTDFKIVNGVLSAAGKDALALDVAGSTDGTLKIYSSISGNLKYFHGKWDGSSSHAISGDSLITYYDSTHVANNAVFNVTNGFFQMKSREPNDTVNFYPAASKYMASGLSEIDVTDAQAAFADWNDTLEVRARIAADVNEDGLVNTTDAMAIMEISVDSTYLSRVGKSTWVFVDSTSLATFESASDSLSGWFAKHKHSISYKLVSQQAKQDFFGVLRGDVNFSYGATADVTTLKKSTSNHVVFSTEEKINARPGDTVWVPMNIALNGERVGGFNTSLQLDPAVFTYTGQFKTGVTIPQGKNWYVTAKADAKGLLRVAGTDFSLNINPIVEDGPALFFKYIVNKDTRRGTVTPIGVNTQTVVDTKLAKIASAAKGGEAEISRMGAAVVTNYELSQNYPNPFNPSTTIEFALPMDSKVDIQIYNLIGQQVATLFSGVQTVGYHQVDFNASQLSSGIYFYTIKATSLTGGQDFRAVKKMMLVK